MEAPEGEREEEKRPIWDISHELDRDGLPLVMCGVPATSGDLCFSRRGEGFPCSRLPRPTSYGFLGFSWFSSVSRFPQFPADFSDAFRI